MSLESLLSIFIQSDMSFFVVLILVSIGVFILMSRKVDEEKGKKPIYQRYFCSGRIGWWWSWYRGGLRVAIYDDFIIVSPGFIRPKVLLEWIDIEKVEVKSYFFSKCLFIFHKKKKLISPIILSLSYLPFRSDEEEKVRKIIQSHLH